MPGLHQPVLGVEGLVTFTGVAGDDQDFFGHRLSPITNESIPEQQRREFVQASPPGEELMRRLRRNIGGVLYADLFERIVIHVDVVGILAAAATAEDDL